MKYSLKTLFVVIVAFNLDDKNCQDVVVDVIDYAVMGCDAPGPRDIIATHQWFRMASASSGMLLKFRQKVTEFVECPCIRLLPFLDDLLNTG